MSPPAVSVIICAYNRPDQVVTCLESLLRLDYEHFEIVAVDDASTDDTPARLASFRDQHPEVDVEIVRNRRNLGVSGARNAGLKAARGELAAFTDSDCTVDRAWLRELAAVFDAPEVAAAGGTVLDEPPRTWAERAVAGSARVGRAGVQNRSLVGGNMCFRREIAAGLGFDPALAYGCDEDELAWRLTSLGYRIEFAPAAIVRHDHPLTFGDYLRVAARQGQGSGRYGYKRGFYLGRDLAFMAAAVLTLPLGLVGVRWLALAAACVLLQLAAMVYNEVGLKGKSPLEAAVVLPACWLFNTVKLWHVARMLARIAAGLEPEIRASKRRWHTRLRRQATRTRTGTGTGTGTGTTGDRHHALDGKQAR